MAYRKGRGQVHSTICSLAKVAPGTRKSSESGSKSRGWGTSGPTECWHDRRGPGHYLAVYFPGLHTPWPTWIPGRVPWQTRQQDRQVGEFGSITHMADGEDHTSNKGVTYIRRFGEDTGEEKGREEGTSLSIIQGERHTHSRLSLKRTKKARWWNCNNF